MTTAGAFQTVAAFGVIKISKDQGAVATATNTVTEIANGMYSLVLTAAEMNADQIDVTIPVTTASCASVPIAIFTSTRRIDDLTMGVAREGTAQAGTATTLQLDASASAVDSFYNGAGIIWTSGANKGVVRIVSGYVGATKTATFAVALPTTADATPTFIVTTIRHALPGADGKALISSDVQDLSASLSVVKTGYALTAGEHTSIAADTQTGMTAQGYTSARAAFLDVLNGLVAAIWAAATRTLSSVTAIVNGVWDEAIAGHLTAGTTGAKLNSAASAGDPLLNTVPGAYGAGTAGAALGNIPAIKAKTDLITTGINVTIVSAISGTVITLYRDTSISVAITGLGNITGNTKLWFSIKNDAADLDSAAVLQIERSMGLTVLNGSGTVTALDGAITVDDATAGNITITLKPASAALLPLKTNMVYDVKVLVGTTVTALSEGGKANVLPAATRAIV